ncbi:MAG TPA: hypothetical protein VH481_07405 [Nitrososphaeraceae archaeon]
MNKCELTLFFVLILSFTLFVQNDSVSIFGQIIDTIHKNYSNMPMYSRNTTKLDTKSINQLLGSANQNNSTIKTVTYTPKFLCGNVSSDEGPVRPGHYDTDISILNKQDYPIKIFWNVIPNDGTSSISIIKTLKSESSTSISCKDILPLIIEKKNLLEGFVMLSLPISGNIISAFPDPNNPEASILRSINDSQSNLVDVQVFYTANALPNLPSEMIFNKIDFKILNDSSERIPHSFLGQALELTLPSNKNQIYDQVSRIKSTLKEKFNLSDSDLNAINIQIDGTDVDAIYTNDDHAISSSRLSPNIYIR